METNSLHQREYWRQRYRLPIRLWSKLMNTVEQARLRQQRRKALQAMDTHLLRDIGVDSEEIRQIRNASKKPVSPWQLLGR